jgi:hypothetical protein
MGPSRKEEKAKKKLRKARELLRTTIGLWMAEGNCPGLLLLGQIGLIYKDYVWGILRMFSLFLPPIAGKCDCAAKSGVMDVEAADHGIKLWILPVGGSTRVNGGGFGGRGKPRKENQKIITYIIHAFSFYWLITVVDSLLSLEK